jgi:hypothetical protein
MLGHAAAKLEGPTGRHSPVRRQADTRRGLEDVRDQIDSLGAAGLPIGWGTKATCPDGVACTWTDKVGLTDPAHDGL